MESSLETLLGTSWNLSTQEPFTLIPVSSAFYCSFTWHLWCARIFWSFQQETSSGTLPNPSYSLCLKHPKPKLPKARKRPFFSLGGAQLDAWFIFLYNFPSVSNAWSSNMFSRTKKLVHNLKLVKTCALVHTFSFPALLQVYKNESTCAQVLFTWAYLWRHACEWHLTWANLCALMNTVSLEIFACEHMSPKNRYFSEKSLLQHFPLEVCLVSTSLSKSLLYFCLRGR